MSQSSAPCRRYEFLRLTVIAAAALLAAADSVLAAGECGSATPDYAARRSVSVAGGSFTSKVYVSGDNIREESSPGGRRIVTIRQLAASRTVTWDETAKTGSELTLPAKPGSGLGQTKIVEEPAAGGGKVRRAQVLQDGKWLDLSVTRCGADNVMTSQTFISVSPSGAQVKGTVTQTGIKVGPVDPSLFKVPADVTIK